jgi:acyl carrier protein
MHIDIIRDRVKKFVMEHFPQARKHGIGDDDQLLGNGVIDSLGILELVTYLEQEFEIRVSDEELMPENFQTIACIAAFTHRKSKANSGQFQ